MKESLERKFLAAEAACVLATGALTFLTECCPTEAQNDNSESAETVDYIRPATALDNARAACDHDMERARRIIALSQQTGNEFAPDLPPEMCEANAELAAELEAVRADVHCNCIGESDNEWKARVGMIEDIEVEGERIAGDGYGLSTPTLDAQGIPHLPCQEPEIGAD